MRTPFEYQKYFWNKLRSKMTFVLLSKTESTQTLHDVGECKLINKKK